jgi:hypothetical protein
MSLIASVHPLIHPSCTIIIFLSMNVRTVAGTHTYTILHIGEKSHIVNKLYSTVFVCICAVAEGSEYPLMSCVTHSLHRPT